MAEGADVAEGTSARATRVPFPPGRDAASGVPRASLVVREKSINPWTTAPSATRR